MAYATPPPDAASCAEEHRQWEDVMTASNPKDGFPILPLLRLLCMPAREFLGWAPLVFLGRPEHDDGAPADGHRRVTRHPSR